MNKYFGLTLLLLFLFLSNQASAACTSPAGADSQTRYDFTAHKMYYCDNTNWVEMGGGAGIIPTNIYSGSVGATTTVPSITYPAYYIISSSAVGYETSGGSDRQCSFKIKINGSWRTIASKNGTGTVTFTASIIQVSATETLVQSSPGGDGVYSGTWNGDMIHATTSNAGPCGSTSVSTTVVKL